MMSAAASLGLLLLWDVDGGLTQIDKFLYSTDDNIKAGAPLAVAVIWLGVYPSSFLDIMEPSITYLVEHHNAAIALDAAMQPAGAESLGAAKH